MKFIILPIILCFLFVSTFALHSRDKWIQNYFNSLKNDKYDKRALPQGKPVNVTASMFILNVDELDDNDMAFKVELYFRQKWNDPRLKFSENEKPLILRNIDEIWTPDLFFVREREGFLHQILNPNIFCRISPNGDVLFSERLTLTNSCPMDLTRFPHDIQRCQLQIESYGHSKEDIALEWGQKSFPPVSAADEITLRDFDLIECNGSSKTVAFSHAEYMRLEVHLTFQRKFGFYAIRLYIPFILLVSLSFLSLWIKAEERGLRLTLLLVILFAVASITSDMNTTIPPAPYIKAIDVWIGNCGFLVFGAFLEFIIVALIAGSGNEDNSQSEGEILLNLESESKEKTLNSGPLPSPLNKLMNMFNARNGGSGRRNASAYRIDKICRIVFPVIFIIFNIVYWSVYCSKSLE